MAETEWLSDTEQASWRAFIWGSRHLFESLDRQLQRDAGMPHTYYVILAMLSEAPDRTLNMSQLANLVHSSASRLSHAVTKLQAQGLVERRRCAEDGRTIYATLTDAGMEAVVDAAPGHVRQVRNVLFDQLTPEQVEQLREIFDSVLLKVDSTDD